MPFLKSQLIQYNQGLTLARDKKNESIRTQD